MKLNVTFRLMQKVEKMNKEEAYEKIVEIVSDNYDMTLDGIFKKYNRVLNIVCSQSVQDTSLVEVNETGGTK